MEAAPEFFQGNGIAGDRFVVEDLLDFSNDDAVGTDCVFDVVTDSSAISAVTESCNSSTFSGSDPGFADVTVFSGDLCVPCDDVAELEWLSNFVEESFSSEDLQNLRLLSGFKTRPDDSSKTRRFPPKPEPEPITNRSNYNDHSLVHVDMPVPAKARSKRSRSATCNWASRRLLHINPSQGDIATSVADAIACPRKKPVSRKKDTVRESNDDNTRRCLHCATDKTPQWRTGPMGPKTLCNACGVRYKSGRLVPEYRPAASPTFVLTKHSNSHRKVVELRRQKELRQRQLQKEQFLRYHNHLMFDVSSNGEDCLIHHQAGPNFRELI